VKSRADESIHGVAVEIPTNHREIPADESIHGVAVEIPTNHRENPGFDSREI